VEPEPQPSGPGGHRRRGVGGRQRPCRGRHLRRHHPDRLRRDHLEALGQDQLPLLAVRAQLPVEDRLRHPVGPRGVPPPALGGRRVEDHGHRRDPVRGRQRQPAGAPLGVGAQGVDDGREPASQTGGDDRLQQGESVRTGLDVLFALAGDGAQPVRRDHLVLREVLPRPGGLAGRRRADEDDERGVRQP
jgi:hypothetical protein